MTDSFTPALDKNFSKRSANSDSPITVLGAGPAGTLISILLARRGHKVTTFERLPDLRRMTGVTGRSINLALADRGIHALKFAGVFAEIEPLLVPMRGRLLHGLNGEQTFAPYGSAAHEMIYSVSRSKLTATLLNCAEREHHVDLRFRQNCISVDTAQHALCVQDIPSGRVYSMPLERVIGADGAGSVLRRYLVEFANVACREEMLTHGYKELTLAAGANGSYLLDANSLHIWPRGEFMMIALPNLDGSFTVTLFLPHDGPQSFASLTAPHDLAAFFRTYFPDAHRLLPDLAQQFYSHPTGSMGTVRCEQWTANNDLVLIGDAAHAIVPFHGQGMNCAFEDCVEFDALLDSMEWNRACKEFESRRKPDCTAIADMALENYVEMRDVVRSPKFQLQRSLSLELERRHPTRFIPRYSMVMFHHEIPYATAFARGQKQNEILESLTVDAACLDDVDFAYADALIAEFLPPLD